MPLMRTTTRTQKKKLKLSCRALAIALPLLFWISRRLVERIPALSVLGVQKWVVRCRDGGQKRKPGRICHGNPRA